jgi:hypothetical protein
MTVRYHQRRDTLVPDYRCANDNIQRSGLRRTIIAVPAVRKLAGLCRCGLPDRMLGRARESVEARVVQEHDRVGQLVADSLAAYREPPLICSQIFGRS